MVQRTQISETKHISISGVIFGRAFSFFSSFFSFFSVGEFFHLTIPAFLAR